jgi:hypothetical protein
MFSIVLALAASAPPPLTPDQQQRTRCVAILAIMAGEQQRRTAAALDLPPLARQGARFAQLVGDQMVKESGRTQAQVKDAILAEVAAVQKTARLPIEEAKGCASVMNAVAPPLPPPSVVQCAGLLKLAADDVRRREGLTKAATDLITLASVLDNRARAELGAAGRSEAESDRELTLAREAIAAKPDTAPDMEACVELAQP